MSPSTFAETYERVLVPAIFRPWAGELLDRARPTAADRVIDVACGTGIVARIVRERCGAGTRITGVDVNPAMLTVARSIVPDIEWREANALQLPFGAATFDLALCQQGLQFFPDRAAALREMRRVLADRGRIALSTWRPLGENPLFLALHQLAAARFGPQMDRRFSFGDADAIGALLVEAGFHDVHAETVTRSERVAEAETFVKLNLGATVASLGELSEDDRVQAITRFVSEAKETIAPFADGGGLRHPVKANLVTAVA